MKRDWWFLFTFGVLTSIVISATVVHADNPGPRLSDYQRAEYWKAHDQINAAFAHKSAAQAEEAKADAEITRASVGFAEIGRQFTAACAPLGYETPDTNPQVKEPQCKSPAGGGDTPPEAK